jgi:hypothetical protein
MTRAPPQDPADADQQWPRTVAESVARLVQSLGQAEKNDIAGTPEDGLIDLYFSPLGATVREDFGLWRGNAALLADCQRARLAGGADGGRAVNPDDAAMVLIRALWVRLRH